MDTFECHSQDLERKLKRVYDVLGRPIGNASIKEATVAFFWIL